MNRHSITGPLILVGAGVLLLLHNISPSLSLGAVVGYWPFGLILVGVAGLIEVLYSASRGVACPPRPISGWVWMVAIFMAISLWGVRHSQIGRLERNGISLLGTTYDYDVSASSGAAGVKRIVFENLKGNLSIKGEKADLVNVSGHRTVRAYNRAEADRADASRIRLDRQGDTLLVHAQENERARSLETGADLDITVPEGVSIEARDRTGDISIEDILGSVDVATGRGDIRLNNVGQDAKIDTQRSGLIRVSNLKGRLDIQGKGDEMQIENIAGQVTVAGKYSGTMDFRGIASPLHFESDITDMRAAAVPGNVTLSLGDLKMKNVSGPIRFQTKTRDVELEGVTDSVEIILERGDIQLSAGTPLPKMDVHTRNGNISLALPEKGAFDLRATTAQGEIENDYGNPLTTETAGRSSSARGLLGTVRVPITVVTDRGTISIRKN